MWSEKLQLYDTFIQKHESFNRRGNSMPHTVANGYMFSQLNKLGEIGLRFSPERCRELITLWDSKPFKAYGAVMRGYVVVPENILNNSKLMQALFSESHAYVLSLPSK